MVPNIFSIATSELSQDAFFTWLLMWGDNSNAKINKELNSVAKYFIRTLTDEEITVNMVKAGRQWENIDIWAEINDDIFITIEDKTKTSDHSKQLERYRKIASDHYKGKRSKLYFIYLKTGNESKSSLNRIEYDGYKVINRKTLLNIFNSQKVENDIFNDFLHNLNTIEDETNICNKLSNIINYRRAGEGFYCKLQEYFNKDRPDMWTDWEYVSNKTSGFIGFWYNWRTTSWDADNKQYDMLHIHIENTIGKGINLVIKISDWKREKDILYNVFKELSVIAKNNGINLVKPKIYRTGISSTVAIVKDAFHADKEDNFDFNIFISTLGKVEKTLSDYVDKREKDGKMPGRAIWGN